MMTELKQIDDTDACKVLWTAVLLQAIKEWLWTCNKGPRVSGLTKRSAKSVKAELKCFFFDEEHRMFEFICQILDLDINAVRESLTRFSNE